jgi:hypothetical protein
MMDSEKEAVDQHTGLSIVEVPEKPEFKWFS